MAERFAPEGSSSDFTHPHIDFGGLVCTATVPNRAVLSLPIIPISDGRVLVLVPNRSACDRGNTGQVVSEAASGR